MWPHAADNRTAKGIMTMLRKIALLSFTFMCYGTATLSAQAPGNPVRDLLPTGRFAVEVLELWAPSRMVELSTKVQRALQADPAWALEHVRRTPRGEPLAYDPRLGVTESEYQEFLLLTDSMKMRPARVDTVVVEAADYGWRFTDGLPALRGIEIDTIRGVVRSPFGELPPVAPIVASAEQRATGPWGGPHWKREEDVLESTTATMASFSVGRHESGHTVIYYDARRAENSRITARETIFLRVLR